MTNACTTCPTCSGSGTIPAMTASDPTETLCLGCQGVHLPTERTGPGHFSVRFGHGDDDMRVKLDGARHDRASECDTTSGWLIDMTTPEWDRPQVCEICKTDVASWVRLGTVTVENRSDQ